MASSSRSSFEQDRHPDAPHRATAVGPRRPVAYGDGTRLSFSGRSADGYDEQGERPHPPARAPEGAEDFDFRQPVLDGGSKVRRRWRRQPKYVPRRALAPAPRHPALRFTGRYALLLAGLALVVSGVAAMTFSPLSPLRTAAGKGRPVADKSAGAVTTPPSIVENPTIPAPATTAPSPPVVAPAKELKPPPNWKPTSIRVPKIGVDAPIDPLGVDEKNALAVPKDTTRVGWWSGGAQPGEPGPSVLVGHRDSTKGPAVFFKLGDLKPGDVIEVGRADGSPARYMVDHLESHPKTMFPTLAVYGATAGPTLRLITCFGRFDRVARSYKNNLVIYANIMP